MPGFDGTFRMDRGPGKARDLGPMERLLKSSTQAMEDCHI